MKILIALAIILAIIATGLLCATLFIGSGGTLVYTSIGAGLALVAFIIVLFAYTKKAVK